MTSGSSSRSFGDTTIEYSIWVADGLLNISSHSLCSQELGSLWIRRSRLLLVSSWAMMPAKMGESFSMMHWFLAFLQNQNANTVINAFMILNILNRMVQAIWKYNQYHHYSVNPLLFSIKLILIPESACTVYTVPLGGLSMQPALCWLPHGFLFLFHQGCKMSSYSSHESQFFSWNNMKNLIYIRMPLRLIHTTMFLSLSFST